MFGNDIEEFISLSIHWPSFEQHAAWSFLNAEIMAHREDAEGIIAQLVGYLDVIESKPEPVLGVLSILTSVPFTTSLLLTVLSYPNPESECLKTLLICFIQHNDSSVIENQICCIFHKFEHNQKTDFEPDNSVSTGSKSRFAPSPEKLKNILTNLKFLLDSASQSGKGEGKLLFYRI